MIDEIIKSGTKWHNVSFEETLSALGVSSDGLAEAEVSKRRGVYGLNKLPEKKSFQPLFLFFHQFKSALIYILIGAAIISFILQDHIDAYVIIAAILLNVVVGFFQEFRAQQALSKLKKIVTFYTSVKRAGQERMVNNQELVPGDIVILQSGNRVPADVRLIQVNNLTVNEASLTGESRPADKTNRILPSAVILAERQNMAFMGTTVASGTAEAVVVATGINTELGQIAISIKEIQEEPTPLQKKLSAFSKTLGIVILSICFGVFLLGLALNYDVKQIFTTAVAIAVAAIPEGLVVTMTVILAIGMQRILKEQALVRKLIAAETLGSTTVICTDKTGTLTEGEMHVVRIITHNHDIETTKHDFRKEDGMHSMASYFLALKMGILCSDAYIENPDEVLEHRHIVGNFTEKALIYVAAQANLNERRLRRENRRLDEIPFDSENKFMVTLCQDRDKKKTIYYKGAPELLLKWSRFIDLDGEVKQISSNIRARLDYEFKRMSQDGLRVIALAFKPVDEFYDSLKTDPHLHQDLIFVAFAGLKDPLRQEARSTIELCRSAGIKPVILTGDHLLTARVVAKELNLPHGEENVIEGTKLERLDEKALLEKVPKVSVYARLNPRDKLRIIDAWQAKGEVVAMTGDGVNDAPALKSADIGIVVGTGTDVAKETADIVLLDSNFKTIVAAVKQGRLIYDNIKKVILYLMSDSFTEMIIISLSLLLKWPLPLLAAQILWINLVTDGFPNIALTMEPEEKDIMKEKPVSSKSPILDNQMKSMIFIISLVTGLVALGLFYGLWQAGDLARARTIIFTAIAVDSLFYVFSIRSLNKPIWRQKLFSNPYLIICCLMGLAVQLLAIYTPFFQNIFQTVSLNILDWFIVLLFCFMTVLVSEITKWFFNYRKSVK